MTRTRHATTEESSSDATDVRLLVKNHSRKPAVSSTRRRDRQRQSRRRGYSLISGALGLVALVTLVPIGFSAYMSLTDPTRGAGGFEFPWVGLANFQTVLGSSVFYEAISFTLVFTLVTVFVEICLGIGIAIAIDRMTVGRSAVIACMLIPWAIITVISAQLWRYIFNGVYGIANAILMWLNIIDEPTSFLSSASTAVVALGVADVWKTTPFVAIIVLGGLQMIDREYYDAAAIDGAGALAKFRAITLPLVKPALITALAFRVLQSFGLFDLPYVLTNGGPGRSTQTVGILTYKLLFGDLNFGVAAAISLITTLMVLATAILLFRISGFHKEFSDHE